MSTIYQANGFAPSALSRQRILGLLWSWRSALGEQRQRRKLRATLSDLSDRELFDMGTTRSEIDYIALNRDLDPRG
jgi:uncharacterized protein YjiS (DUF1127 family)